MPTELRVNDTTEQAIRDLEHGAQHFIAQLAMRVRDVAKLNLHVGYGVDTGAMQESVSAVTSEGSDYAEHVANAAEMRPEAKFAPEPALAGSFDATVIVPVHYAAIVELGPHARPFLIPAVEIVASQADNIALEAFEIK